VINDFLGSEELEQLDANLPPYVPFLQGSRYSLNKETASFSNLTLETTREDMLLGLLKGNALYHRGNIEEVGRMVPLGNRIMTSGGASKIEGFLDAKKHWTGDFEMRYQDQSSLLGSAMLGQFYLTGRYEQEQKPVEEMVPAAD
jgi:sugar (pentulose or hexulose) kinase